MESLALATVFFLTVALLEGAALAKAVANAGALLGSGLEGLGLGVESHGDSGVKNRFSLTVSCGVRD